MHNSGSPGFNRTAHEEMMMAILSVTEQRDHGPRDPFTCFVIHSPDQP
jgi:hypothetical protein